VSTAGVADEDFLGPDTVVASPVGWARINLVNEMDTAADRKALDDLDTHD